MKLVNIDRQLTVCLNRIGMEQNAVFLCDLTDLFDRLNGSDLIVCKHNGDQDRIRTNCFFQFIHFYDTVFIHTDVSDLKTTFFQIFCGMQDRMMLDLGRDDVFSFALISFCRCFQCPVICLGTTGCEINLIFLCSQSLCDRSSCI